MSTLPKFVPGDVVNVKGYGGSAIVKNVEQDGTTPQGHPKWLYTIEFGAFDDTIGYALKNAPMGRWAGVGRTLKKAQGRHHQFYQGRLEPFFNQQINNQPEAETTNVEVNYSELNAEELTELLAMLGLKVTNKANENQSA